MLYFKTLLFVLLMFTGFPLAALLVIAGFIAYATVGAIAALILFGMSLLVFSATLWLAEWLDV